MVQNPHHGKLAILFADICGSTSLYDKLGYESALKLINHTLSLLVHEIEAHDGTLIKTIGDEIMCTFPGVVEAVNAAIAMHQVLDAKRPGGKHPIFVRIGLHYGDVIHGMDVIHVVNDVFGDVVNMAARVTAYTRARQIMTTQAVVDALPSSFSNKIRSSKRASPRGMKDPLALCMILWEPDSASTIRVGKATFRKPSQARNELLLRYKQKVITLNQENKSITLGRGENCDLIIETNLASRHHLQIDYSFGKFILYDYSVNGTYIQLSDKKTVQLNQQQIVLHGRGTISLGMDFENHPSELIEYLVQ
jgi:class 3 adenylate cyclase